MPRWRAKPRRWGKAMSPAFRPHRARVRVGTRCSFVVMMFATLSVPATARPSPMPEMRDARQQAAHWDDATKAALLSALADRARHGLDHVTFLDRNTAGAATDEMYRDAALRYAGALAHGLVDPATLHDPFELARAHSDLGLALDAAAATGTLTAWLAGLAPQDAEYAQLSQAYLDLRDRPADDGDGHIAKGVLRVGDADARVSAIVEQLVAGEYLPATQGLSAATGEMVYTRQIADAVKQLQRDYGIAADGVVGPDTLGVLNLGAGDKARAIAVALERRRWLDRTPPPTRIDVNTAAARLYYYRDGRLVDSRRVVVGKPGTETPPLQSPIYRLVANPTWTVPKSIQYGELAKVGASYLRRNNMELRNGWIVQRSGPGNALGLVKFDMRNTHAIYLHDTSAPALFARSERHRSHGCVRVEDALGFAQLLAEDQGIADAWQAARTSGAEQFVALTTPIPVRLIYRNVFVDLSGKIAFRTDPYGWNAPIAKALGFTDRVEAHLRNDATDIAP